MARLARKNINTPFLHVMVQGINKEFIFENDIQKQHYMNIINENYPLYDLKILAYCIMSNHVHILFYTKDINELSRFMHVINLKYASSYNYKNNRCGVIFRNRYKIQPIENRDHLLCCINYIHQNPVKANMVSSCDEYKYSSYNDYLNNTGYAKNTILGEILDMDYNFVLDSKIADKRIFIDIDKPSQQEINNLITNAIIDFINSNNLNLVEIFSDKTVFKSLLYFLKNTLHFSYKNIQDYFEITQYSINKLKI